MTNEIVVGNEEDFVLRRGRIPYNVLLNLNLNFTEKKTSLKTGMHQTQTQTIWEFRFDLTEFEFGFDAEVYLRMSRATIIMISSLIKDSSDGFDAVSAHNDLNNHRGD